METNLDFGIDYTGGCNFDNTILVFRSRWKRCKSRCSFCYDIWIIIFLPIRLQASFRDTRAQFTLSRIYGSKPIGMLSDFFRTNFKIQVIRHYGRSRR